MTQRLVGHWPKLHTLNLLAKLCMEAEAMSVHWHEVPWLKVRCTKLSGNSLSCVCAVPWDHMYLIDLRWDAIDAAGVSHLASAALLNLECLLLSCP